jgi:putative transposase
MPRQARVAPGGWVFHVLNRAVAGRKLFAKEADYQAFEKVLRQALARTPTRLLAWCLMPTHWHLVIWPREDGELSAFVRWLTHTHVQRWHAHRHSAGSGHVYQGRFKSFPIQEDEHLLTALRYVERNALRARLVERAEQWRWGSAWARHGGSADHRAMLAQGPARLPQNWIAFVNQAQTPAELVEVRQSLKRCSPLGSAVWRQRSAARLGLEWTLRPRGRPSHNASAQDPKK